MKSILIVKLGTSVVTVSEFPVLLEVSRQLAELSKRYRVVLVCSGAVAFGKQELTSFKKSNMAAKRAAASVGNAKIISHFVEWLKPYGMSAAQALLERHHFSDRKAFLNLRGTFEFLWENNVIPVVNENDVVSNVELKFSDNDELATLLAAGFMADKLLFGTAAAGLLDEDGEVVGEVREFSEDVLSLAKGGSVGGLGGMRSKLNCAKLATRLGTDVVIFDARVPGNVLLAEKNEVGTICPGKECDVSTQQRWMASGTMISGSVVVDDGAEKALKAGKSLLLVGVVEIRGEFDKRDFFEIFNGDNEFLGVGRAKYDSVELKESMSKKGVQVAHADEVVLF